MDLKRCVCKRRAVTLFAFLALAADGWFGQVCVLRITATPLRAANIQSGHLRSAYSVSLAMSTVLLRYARDAGHHYLGPVRSRTARSHRKVEEVCDKQLHLEQDPHNSSHFLSEGLAGCHHSWIRNTVVESI